MKFGSLFSGIEAASAAWLPLGWSCAWVAEIDPFACAVLRHHYPTVPNLGDITEVAWDAVLPVDLVVGGPPCQDFSVAGKRAGLEGERGDLSLAYARALDAIDPVWSLTENVPGWLSMGDNSFGHFLGRLVGADAALVPGRGQRWTDAGVVAGPRRTAAWRILDAQYWGVPQRRRRVFVLALRGAGNWACAEALFPVGQGVRGNTPPRREAGQDAAAAATYCLDLGGNKGMNGGGWSTDLTPPLGTNEAHAVSFGGGIANRFAADIAPPVTGSNPYGDHESREGLLVAFGGGNTSGHLDVATACIAHTLRADGFDAGEDGTGRGTPLIPIQNATRGQDQNGLGVGGEAMFTLDGASQHAVAYGIRHDAARNGAALTPSADAEGRVRLRDPGFNLYEETAPTLDSAPHAIAFHENQRAETRLSDTAGALKVGGGKPGQGYPAAMQGMSVRRLTPRECERLQGFPDDYTLIPYRGKPASDGPRYRAIGNSMAVPVVRWLGSRIQQFDDEESAA